MLLMEESILNDISKKLEELYYKVYMKDLPTLWFFIADAGFRHYKIDRTKIDVYLK